MDGFVKTSDYPINHNNETYVHRKHKRKRCPFCTFVDEWGNPSTEGSCLIQNSICTVVITHRGMLKITTPQGETFTKINNCVNCGRKL